MEIFLHKYYFQEHLESNYCMGSNALFICILIHLQISFPFHSDEVGV
jgi:hypothetical protein